MLLVKNHISIEFTKNARIILDVMLDAFEQTRKYEKPSSALFETVEQIEGELASGKEALVLYEDGEPCAMMKVTTKEDNLYFARLSVKVAHRKKGYATILIDYLGKLANARGLSKITCNVRADEPENIAYYERLGFAIVQSRIFHHPHGYTIDIFELEKQL